MHKLGFTVKMFSKCIYCDGHERSDVLSSWQKYKKQITHLIKGKLTDFAKRILIKLSIQL